MDVNAAALIAVMAPPPEGGDDCDWDAIAAETGWRFPEDYRDLVGLFGAGEIEGGASFGSPPRRGEPMSTGILRHVAGPPADGMLAWGGSDVGETYYWRCGDDDPERWTVAVRSRADLWTDFEMGVAEFLVRLLNGTLGKKLALDLASTSHRFIGWRETQAEYETVAEDFGYYEQDNVSTLLSAMRRNIEQAAGGTP